MASAPQILANTANAQLSTGPRTDTGKQKSSKNAVTFGLFAMRDYICPDEQAEYDALSAQLALELKPEGIVENAQAGEILSAIWRLRRCSAVESCFSGSPFEPMMRPDEREGRTQASVDRARNMANHSLKRATAELRRLQTDRAVAAVTDHVEDTHGPLADRKQIVQAIVRAERLRTLPKTPVIAEPSTSSLASFCNEAAEPEKALRAA